MFAAYLYVPGRRGKKAARTEHLVREVVMVDHGADGKPNGAEVLEPIHKDLALRMVRALGLPDDVVTRLGPILKPEATGGELVSVSIRIPMSYRKRGEAVARRQGRKFSGYVRGLIEQDLAGREA